MHAGPHQLSDAADALARPKVALMVLAGLQAVVLASLEGVVVAAEVVVVVTSVSAGELLLAAKVGILAAGIADAGLFALGARWGL